MMLVTASSTARVTDRHSRSEKPIISVNRSIAPRTTDSNSGLLGNSSFSSKSVFNVSTCPPAWLRKIKIFSVFSITDCSNKNKNDWKQTRDDAGRSPEGRHHGTTVG